MLSLSVSVIQLRSPKSNNLMADRHMYNAFPNSKPANPFFGLGHSFNSIYTHFGLPFHNE